MPVPAVQGGAVEALVDHYLDYNNRYKLHDITVFSVYHPLVKDHPALQSDVNHYRYINTTSLLAKARRRIHSMLHKDVFYHPSIDYYFCQTLKYIRRHKFDAIILENRPGYALKLQRMTKARLVFHLHNDFLNSTIPYWKQQYHSAARILTVSDYIKGRVLTCNPADTKTVTVHNGIDLTPFSAVSSMSRKSLGFEDDDFILAFSGRLIPEKGIMELVEAMKMLNGYPKIKLLVMGSSFYGNTDKEGAFIQQLKSRAAGLEERITFTGFVKHELMPDYLRVADVAVIPSTWEEPFGLTVLEGMAAGLPIITTNRGGIPEIVTKDNAVIIPCGDDFASKLADAILSLYNDRERLQRMGEVSRQLSQNYSKDRYAQDFLSLL